MPLRLSTAHATAGTSIVHINQTGDVVKAVVPKGKYRGNWAGALACRKNGYFDIKNKEGKRIA